MMRKVSDLEKFYENTISADQFKKGLEQIIRKEQQSKLALNYLKVERDEVSYREKVQNDIIKDV